MTTIYPEYLKEDLGSFVLLVLVRYEKNAPLNFILTKLKNKERKTAKLHEKTLLLSLKSVVNTKNMTIQKESSCDAVYSAVQCRCNLFLWTKSSVKATKPFFPVTLFITFHRVR